MPNLASCPAFHISAVALKWADGKETRPNHPRPVSPFHGRTTGRSGGRARQVSGDSAAYFRAHGVGSPAALFDRRLHFSHLPSSMELCKNQKRFSRDGVRSGLWHFESTLEQAHQRMKNPESENPALRWPAAVKTLPPSIRPPAGRPAQFGKGS